jgi:hypothetical protein
VAVSAVTFFEKDGDQQGGSDMKKEFKLAVMCLLLVFSFFGCFPKSHTALTIGQTNIDTSKKSLALMTFKVSNQNVPSSQPNLDFAFIVPKENPSTIPMAMRKYVYEIDAPYRSEANGYNEYLLSFSLEPGTYHLRSFSQSALLFAHCNWHSNMKIEVKPNSILYLGHVDAVIRKKKDGESTNCSIYPFIENAAAGFSSGFLEVKISDNYDDVKLFTTAYTGLKNVVIERAILPPWNNPGNKYNDDINLAQ